MNTSGENQDALFAAMFKALAGHAEEYLSCVDRQRRVLYLNRSLSRSVESVLGQPIERFISDAWRDAAVQAIEAAFTTGLPQRFEFEVQLADGSPRSFEQRITPFTVTSHEPLALQVTLDLSERRRLEAALSESEQFRRLIVEHLPDYAVLLDRQRRFRWMNRAAPGLSIPDLLGLPVDRFVASDMLPIVVNAIESAFETGELTQYEVQAYGDGTQQAWYLTRVVPVRNADVVDHVLLLTSDVTQRKQAELALRASEERFRALTEHSPDLIAIVGRERVIEFLNRAPPGQSLKSIVGRRLEEFASPEQTSTLLAAFETVFSTGNAAEYEATSPGTETLFRVRLSPLTSSDGPARALAVATDMTRARADERARSSLQAQLHQAQRRESVGMLAGGIAHDFNNLLQVIQTNLHMASELLQPSGLALEELTEALRASERAAELTAHLLAIGRRQRVDPRSVDLSKLVERSLRMLRRVIPETIEVAFEPSSEPCFASVDPPQLEQVLLNLCLNARDAMPNGGHLGVSVGVVDEGRKAARLSVRDTGIGISEANLKQIFEPFFTTKRAGSGLGLAVAAGIVAAHGGLIRVESRPGEGSVFLVDLPLSSATPELLGSKADPEARGNELVLVAEDDALVRAQAVRVLQRAGYSVLEAENGVQALEVFSARRAEIKLVLLDVIMPGLDGWQVFLRLEALSPGVKVLFITGYAASALPEDFSVRGKRLLSKPYKPRALLELVRTVLDGE